MNTEEATEYVESIREAYIDGVLADGAAITEAVETVAAIQFMAFGCGLSLKEYLTETAEYMALKYSQGPEEGLR